MDKLKAWWELRDSKEKRNFMIVGGVLAIIIVLWMIPGQERVERPKPVANVEVDILADDRGEADLQRQAAEIKNLQDQLKRLERNDEQMGKRYQRIQDTVSAATGIAKNPEQLGQLLDEINTLTEKVRQLEESGVRVGGQSGAPVLVLGEETKTSNDAAPTADQGITNPFENVDESSPLSMVDPLKEIQSSIKEDNKRPNDSRFSFMTDQNFERPPAKIMIDEPDPKTAQARRTGGSVPGQTSRDQRGEVLDAVSMPEVYIPSHSLFQGVLLTGMDAPTGSNSAREPYPVTIRLTSLAFLPNRYTTNLRECFVGAAGYGRLDSERVHLRTETLSCVLNDGGIIDTSIDGWVTGKDGKVGLRGTVVERTGALLARAALAGLGSGFADALEPQQVRSVRTGAQAGGVEFDAPDTSEVLEIGAYSGASEAMESISDYYLERAEQIFPIIELDALTEVTVHLNKGVYLETLDDGTYGTLANNGRTRE